MEEKDIKNGPETEMVNEETKQDVKESKASEKAKDKASKKEAKAEAKARKQDEKKEKEKEKEKEKAQENELKIRCAEIQDKYVRLAAEFDNYRRRTAKERLELINSASEEVIKGILPILDDFERALDALSKSEASDSAKEGTELIYNKMVSFLKSRGVEKIEAMGQPLDTDKHEAIAQMPVQEEEKKNIIIDVTQQGYTLHGKVIRFAKVVMGV